MENQITQTIIREKVLDYSAELRRYEGIKKSISELHMITEASRVLEKSIDDCIVDLEEEVKVWKDRSEYTYITTILEDCGVPKPNGRIFTREAVEVALNKGEFQRFFKTNNLVVQAVIPYASMMKKTPEEILSINPFNTCGIIVDYWWIGDTLWGMIETTNSEYGKDLSGVYKQGSDVRFSIHGQGEVKDGVVQEGFEIVSWNWVVGDPSSAVEKDKE